MTKCDFAPVKLPSLSVQAKRKKSETSLLDRVLWCLPGDLASSGQGARSSERPVLPPRLLNPMVAKAPWTCTSPHLRPHLAAAPCLHLTAARLCPRRPLRLQRLPLLISTCSQMDRLERQLSHQRPRAKTRLSVL